MREQYSPQCTWFLVEEVLLELHYYSGLYTTEYYKYGALYPPPLIPHRISMELWIPGIPVGKKWECSLPKIYKESMRNLCGFHANSMECMEIPWNRTAWSP